MISLVSQIPYVHLLFCGRLGSFMSPIPSVSVLFYGGLGFMSHIPSVYICMYNYVRKPICWYSGGFG